MYNKAIFRSIHRPHVMMGLSSFFALSKQKHLVREIFDILHVNMCINRLHPKKQKQIQFSPESKYSHLFIRLAVWVLKIKTESQRRSFETVKFCNGTRASKRVTCALAFFDGAVGCRRYNLPSTYATTSDDTCIVYLHT